MATSAICLTPRSNIVNIKGMGKLVSYLIIVFAAGICGCTEPRAVEPEPSTERIKITDLMGSDVEKFPPAIKFKLYTFEMPSSNLPMMESVFDALSKRGIKFINRKAFDRNAFFAGIGGKDMWAAVWNQLKIAKAKKISTSNIIILDKEGYELPVKEVMDTVSLTYIDSTTQIVERSIRGGVLAWRIKAGAAMQRKGTAIIKLDPLLRQQRASIISKAVGIEDYGLTVFKSNSMMMNIEEGQFLILSPHISLSKADKGTARSKGLAEAFFISRGDFITPLSGSAVEVTGGARRYDFQKDIPLARLYLLVCVEVGN